MKVRAARRADVPRLLEIERDSFTTDRLTAAKLRHLLARGNCTLDVVLDRGTVAGYVLVLFRRGSRYARIYGLAVAPAARGRGLARVLLAAAERRARGRRAARIGLEAAAANVRARGIYERAGYEVVRALGPYYADGSEAVRMAKRLAGVSARDSSGAPRRGSVQIPRPQRTGRRGAFRGAVPGRRQHRAPPTSEGVRPWR